MHRSTLALLAALCPLTVACDDAASIDPPLDAQVMDAGPDIAIDAAPPLDAMPDQAIDAQPDAGPDLAVDMQPDVYVPLPPSAPISGEGERLPNGDTAPGEGVTWMLPAPHPTMGLQVRARIWRWNDGEVQLQVDDGPVEPAIILGDADAGWRFVRRRSDAPAGGLPSPIEIPPAATRVRIIAEGGPIALGDLRLADASEVEPPITYDTPEPEETIAIAPCGADCDDGASLTAALAEAPPDGQLTVALAGRYHLRTPWRIQRDHVRIVGDDATIHWDPDAEPHRAAIEVTGAGPQGPRLPVEGAVTNGQYRFVVTPPPDWAPRWVRMVADDFGGIAATCENTRDQEQLHRHISQLAEVMAITPLDETRVEVWTDRPLFLAVPVDANPGLQAVGLREGVHLEDLALSTACPEALENTRFDRVACTNPAVIEDDGILFQWTDDARAVRVAAQGTGKYAVDATHALRTRVIDCRFSHPSDYGEGGKGYGVHLIRASRSVVRGMHVTQARHGVVVDFGSSDSQVLDGEFSAMNQAFIDVHGEASRDTLIRGNLLRDGPLGVIVGGGGGFAHCNDGPRQYVHQNRAEGITNAAMTAFFATRDVFVLQNDFDATLFGAVVGFDAEALLEGNIIRRARIGVQAADGGRAVVRGNVFTDACDEAAASLNANGEIVFEAGNQYCP